MIWSWTVVETPRQRVGQLLDDALRETRTQHKAAWLAAGYANGSSWTRALQGERGYSLDLNRLIDGLSPDTWIAFLPKLIGVVFERHGVPPETWFSFLPKLIALFVERQLAGDIHKVVHDARALRGADASPTGDVDRDCRADLAGITPQPVRAQLKASRTPSASDDDRDTDRRARRVG